MFLFSAHQHSLLSVHTHSGYLSLRVKDPVKVARAEHTVPVRVVVIQFAITVHMLLSRALRQSFQRNLMDLSSINLEAKHIN